MFEEEFKNLLSQEKISWITEIDPNYGDGSTEYELTLEDESGFTCLVYVETQVETAHLNENFGLGEETHESKHIQFKITEVENLVIWDQDGTEKEVSEELKELKELITKYIKTGK